MFPNLTKSKQHPQPPDLIRGLGLWSPTAVVVNHDYWYRHFSRHQRDGSRPRLGNAGPNCAIANLPYSFNGYAAAGWLNSRFRMHPLRFLGLPR